MLLWGEGRRQEPARLHLLMPVLGGALALAVVVLAYLTAHPRPERTLVEQWLSDLLAPLQTGSARLARGLGEAVQTLGRLGQLRRENERLREELEQLRLQLNLMAGVSAENQQLRQALALPPTRGFSPLAAEVIQRQPTRWYAQVVTNRGRREGVALYMPVMAPGGLVGQVVQLSDHTSTVRLISDVGAAVGGLVVRTGDLVLVEGSDLTPRLRVKGLSNPATFESGDVVVTSGLGGVYPRGILIGTVVQVRELPGGLGREGWLRAAADLERLNVVYFLLPGASQGR